MLLFLKYECYIDWTNVRCWVQCLKGCFNKTTYVEYIQLTRLLKHSFLFICSGFANRVKTVIGSFQRGCKVCYILCVLVLIELWTLHSISGYLIFFLDKLYSAFRPTLRNYCISNAKNISFTKPVIWWKLIPYYWVDLRKDK